MTSASTFFMFFNQTTISELDILLESHTNNLGFTAETTKPFQQTIGLSHPPVKTMQQV